MNDMNTEFLDQIKEKRDEYIRLKDKKDKLQSLLKELNTTLFALEENMANLWQENALRRAGY